MKKLLITLCILLQALPNLTADLAGADDTGGMAAPAIGIDLGSSHVRVAVFHRGRPTALKSDQGGDVTPACVAFAPAGSYGNGQRLVGDLAKSQLADNPRNTLFHVLPLIGRKYDDEVVQEHLKLVPYSVFESQKGAPAIDAQVGDNVESFSPEEVLAMLLRKMKQIGERHLGESVTSAVVSVSSCLSYAQRRAVRDAGRIAGISQTRIVNSHVATAVALAHRLGGAEKYSAPRRILVFDLGDSSLGVSVMSIGNGSVRTEAHAAECGLGGSAFQQRVTDQMLRLFGKQRGPALSHRLRRDARALQKLRREVEKAVRQLSSVETATIEVDSLIDGLDFSQVLTRARFEELNSDAFNRVLQTVARLHDDRIQEVVIVGGSSGIPMIRQRLQFLFELREPKVRLDPATASAVGASVLAAIQDGTASEAGLTDLAVEDRYCAKNLGYKTITNTDFSELVGSGDSIPAEKSDLFRITKIEKVSQAIVGVYEGDGSCSLNCSLVEAASIDFPATKLPLVSVTFSMSQHFVLQVKLKELTTGVSSTATLDHRLDATQLKRMRQRLQSLEDADRFELKRVEARDELESLVYLLRRQISRAAEYTKSQAIRADEFSRAERAIEDAFRWLEANSRAQTEEYLARQRLLVLAVQKFKL